MTAAALKAHLETGATHVCNCWQVKRRDGAVLGFTDHDNPLRFAETDFIPQSGLSARAVASTTGLSVNNSEALGVLQSDAISAADINAGRYDSAQVTVWQVQWDNPDARKVLFAGTIGAITRANGGFEAELRGLTDALNQSHGRAYMRQCSAVLGGAECRFDLSAPGYFAELTVTEDASGTQLVFADVDPFNDDWFTNGKIEVLSGQSRGVIEAIKLDRRDGTARNLTLWQPIAGGLRRGDQVRLTAGCDKRAETCRVKFANFLNFRGFPDIPGDDWLVSVPRPDGKTSGGSLFR